MSLLTGTTVGNYKILRNIGRKSEYFLYEAENELNKKFFAAEFYPEGICARDEEGFVIPLEGFEEDFVSRLNRFKQGISRMKSISSSNLIRIFKTEREEKDNCICVFPQPESTPLLEYLGKNGGKLTYKQAFDLIQPLSEALDRASGYGLHFYTDINNLYINAFSNMESTGFLVFDYNIGYICDDLANVYYTMITGGEYSKLLAKPSEAGAVLPETLDNFIYETLFVNNEYLSISEFISKIKDSVLFDTKMAVTNYSSINNINTVPPAAEPVERAPEPIASAIPPQRETVNEGYVPPAPQDIRGSYIPPAAPNRGTYYQPDSAKKQSGGGKFLAGCLVGGCLSLIISLILIGVVSYNVVEHFASTDITSDWLVNEINYSTAYPEPTQGISIQYAESDANIQVNAYLYRSFYNDNLIFDSTVCQWGDFFYYRKYIEGEKNMWALVKSHKDDLSQWETVVENVMPSFLSEANDVLYYSDGFQNNNIFAVALNTEGNISAKRISGDSCAFLTAYDDSVYFVNLNEGSSLNSFNFKTGKSARINVSSCNNLNIYDDKLIFIMKSGSMFSLCAYDFASGKESIIAEKTINFLSSHDEKVFFIDGNNNVGYFDENWNEVHFDDFIYTNYFDISADNMYYIDYSDYEIVEMDLSSQKGESLGIDAVYFQIIGDYIFYYDYIDEYFHRFDLKTGESLYLYEGYPDYFTIKGF